MSTSLVSLSAPTEIDAFVAFSDLTVFMKSTAKLPPRELFDLMSDWAAIVGDVVESSGGHVVKFMGDAAMMAWPVEKSDAAARALLELNRRVDELMEKRGYPCRMRSGAHAGPVTAGPFGTKREKRFDIYGETVMIAASVTSHGVALTAEAFRKLKPESRTLFKKHTPPVRYIPVDEKHRD